MNDQSFFGEVGFESYSKKAIQHFLYPRNSGYLADEDGLGHVISPDSEDFVELSIKVDRVLDCISDIRCRCMGSPACMASASALTDLVIGLPLDEVDKLSPEDLLNALDGLPPHRHYCADLCVRALQAAVQNFRQR